MVEQLICNQWVAGSIPVTGSTKHRVGGLFVSHPTFLFVVRHSKAPYELDSIELASPLFQRAQIFPFCTIGLGEQNVITL